jgi:uncharacterized UPF0160 family protein
MAFLTDVMINAVKYRVGAMLAVEQVRQSEVLEGGKVLFLKNSALPWTQVVRKEMPQVLFVISHSPGPSSATCCTPCRPAPTASRRAPTLPEAWAGLRDAELAAVTGVPDAGFCHNGRFIAAVKSYEGARAMVTLALQALAQQPVAPATND